MPLQQAGTVNFRELPQGDYGAQMKQNTTLITLNVSYQIRAKMFLGEDQTTACEAHGGQYHSSHYH